MTDNIPTTGTIKEALGDIPTVRTPNLEHWKEEPDLDPRDPPAQVDPSEVAQQWQVRKAYLVEVIAAKVQKRKMIQEEIGYCREELKTLDRLLRATKPRASKK